MLLHTSESSDIWVILIEDDNLVQKTKREGASTLLLRINERHHTVTVIQMPVRELRLHRLRQLPVRIMSQ